MRLTGRNVKKGRVITTGPLSPATVKNVERSGNGLAVTIQDGRNGKTRTITISKEKMDDPI